MPLDLEVEARETAYNVEIKDTEKCGEELLRSVNCVGGGEGRHFM